MMGEQEKKVLEKGDGGMKTLNGTFLKIDSCSNLNLFIKINNS